MPLKITQRDIEEAHRYARDAMGQLRGVGRSDGALSRTTSALAKGVAVCAGAGAVGLLSGKYGSAELHIGGKDVPLDLLGGLAGKAAAVFMEDGMASECLDNFSSGVLAAFVTKYTIGLGKSWGETGSLFPSKPAAPAISGNGRGVTRMMTGGTVSPPQPLTERELANMAMGIR